MHQHYGELNQRIRLLEQWIDDTSGEGKGEKFSCDS